MKLHLILQVPKQQDFENPVVELSPKKVSLWLEQLPLLNLAPTLKELLAALETFNQSAMPEKVRLRLAELYRDTVIRIFPTINKGSNAKDWESIRENMGALCLAIADTYKIIVKQLYKEGIKTEKNSVLLISVYRAMEMLSFSLLHSFRTYYPASLLTYLEINQLYFLAEQYHVLETPIVYEQNEIGKHDIGTLYKKLMLLAAIDPFHLNDGLAVSLYKNMDPYAKYCEITPVEINDKKLKDRIGCFLIDLESDSPPTPCNKSSSGYLIEIPRLIDTWPMIEQIREKIKELADSRPGSPESAELEMLKQILPLSDLPSIRQSDRNNAGRNINIAFGIEAAHYLLSLNEERFFEIQSQEFTAGHAEPDNEESPLLETWVIRNESVSGYLLTSKNRPDADIHVGDVISIIDQPEKQMAKRPSVALIRWLKHKEGKDLEIGAEILPGEVLPLKCCRAEQESTSSTDDNSKLKNGLFLSSVSALNIPPTLLLPKNMYRRGYQYEAVIGDNRLIIEAGFLSQDSSSFDRFEFSTARQD